MARRKRKPGPKPGFNPVVNARRAAAKKVAAAQPKSKDPLQRSRFVKTMTGDELRGYARQVGVRELDVTSLSEDKLRQNCLLRVASLVEHLMGD